MTCKCGNAARYVNERNELCCGICPLGEGIDSVKIGVVGDLLKLVREAQFWATAAPGPQRDAAFVAFGTKSRELTGKQQVKDDRITITVGRKR